MMDEKEARTLFKEADRLYQSDHYVEALQHLAALANEFPEDFNVLYPILLCREKLGRIEEARELCTELMEKFNEPKRRHKLCRAYQRLMRSTTPALAASKTPPGNECIKDAPYVREVNPSGIIDVAGRWIPLGSVLIALAVSVVIISVLAALPFLLPRDEEGVVTGIEIVLLVFGLLAQYVLNCVVFYLALWSTNKLLHEDLVLDIIDVCIFAPIFGLLTGIAFIGWVIAYFLFAPRYNMNLFEFIIFVVVIMVFNLVLLYMILPGIFGAGVLAF